MDWFHNYLQEIPSQHIREIGLTLALDEKAELEALDFGNIDRLLRTAQFAHLRNVQVSLMGMYDPTTITELDVQKKFPICSEKGILAVRSRTIR